MSKKNRIEKGTRPHPKPNQLIPVDKPFSIAGVNEEFARPVNEFIQQYRPALEELAK